VGQGPGLLVSGVSKFACEMKKAEVVIASSVFTTELPGA
jgi:hypothetical protein